MKVKKVDLVFLGILALSSVISLLSHFISGYVLSINDYVGFLFLSIVIFFQYKSGKFRAGIPILLALGSLSILGFSYVAFNSSFIHLTDDITYNPIGFNSVLFLMLVVYCFINYNFIKILLIGKPNEEVNEDKMTAFYYNKFAECDIAEFKDIAKRIDMYPAEAQEAIQQLIAERNI